MNEKKIKLRPHHLLCIQNYRGHGYSALFNKKMNSVINALQSPEGAWIEIAEGADHLCQVCPHCRDGFCDSDPPALFDRLVCEHTGLVPGNTLRWKLSAEMLTDSSVLYRANDAQAQDAALQLRANDAQAQDTGLQLRANDPRVQDAALQLRTNDARAQDTFLPPPAKDARIPAMSRELLQTCCPGCSWKELCLEIISTGASALQ